jgi:streptomycin 6-kinase
MTAVAAFPLPRNLVKAARRDGRSSWLATLPGTVVELERRWTLSLGPPFQPGGVTSWVAPARRALSEDLVLKVTWRHRDAQHEADGLREWNGDGAVRLHATAEFDDAIALLLERAVPGTALSLRSQPDQDDVIAALLRRLWRDPAPGHPFRPLHRMCAEWADEFEEKNVEGKANLDAALVQEGVALFRALPDSADRSVLLSTDLHAGNVLAAEREPWLVIDPKPYVGDPTYDALQHLLNCRQRLHADPRGFVRQMAGLLGLDPDRLLQWLFARCVVESVCWPSLAPVARSLWTQ